MTNKHETYDTSNGVGLSDSSSPYQNDPFMPDYNPQPVEYQELPQQSLVPQTNPQALTLSVPEDATVEERLTMMQFMGSATPLWDELGNWLEIEGVVALPGWKRDKDGKYVIDTETGELVACMLTFWRDTSGKLYHSQSPVAYSWCQNTLWPIMTKKNRPGMLLAPVSIRVGIQHTKAGNKTFKFDIR